MNKDKTSSVSSRKSFSFSEKMAEIPKCEPFVPPSGAVPIDWSAIDKPPGRNFHMDVINGYWIPDESDTVAENVSDKLNDKQNEVQQEQWYTIAPATPNKTTSIEKKATVKPKAKRQMRKPEIAEATPSVELTPEPQPEVVLAKEEPTIEPQSEAVEQSRKTRRSAKMYEADFDMLAAAFLFPTELAEKKPLFFPEKTRESLRKVAGLIPGGKVSPSHVAIHIVNAWLDEHRDLLNRMFANQKTSI